MNHFLKYMVLYIVLILSRTSVLAVPCHFLSTDFNRTAFYEAIESDNKALIDAQISVLNSAPANIKNAFLGAMIMKRAGVGGNPFSKLERFKKGHKLLEDAIKTDPNNSEFRFLRLMIQENAPGFLGYDMDEQRDSEFIRKAYKSLPEDLQKTISEYNKSSRVLKLQA
jgi:tetratricopeptide (TPR) repeat protein